MLAVTVATASGHEVISHPVKIETPQCVHYEKSIIVLLCACVHTEINSKF